MKPLKLVIGVMVILLVTGVGSVSAYAPDASRAHSHGLQAPVQLVPVWQQVNSNGFGDPETGEVTALEAFNGYLYAGTHNLVAPGPVPIFDGAQIFRSSNGVSWTPVTQPGFSNPHDTAAPAILDFVAFNSYLYASTGRGGNPGQIWRSSNGTAWSPTINYGFGDENNVDITALAVYSNKIYAGVTSSSSGVQIWRSSTGDNAIGSWTKVAPGVGMSATRITGFAAFNGALYAALESGGPAQIWRSSTGDLNAWSAIVSNGFGDSNNTASGGIAVFGGDLYVGVGNSVDGARLYHTSNGTNWTQAITPGFGDANNQKIELVYVFQNRLYVSVKNTLTGIKLWSSANGTHWERANLDGFGDSHNTGSNWGNATAGFRSHLYVGTSNVVDGGELWQMQIGHLYVPLTLH